MGQAHGLWVARARDRLIFWQCFVHFPEILEVIVLEGLSCGHAVTIVVDKQFGYDFLRIR